MTHLTRPVRVFLTGVRSQAHVVYAASWIRAQLQQGCESLTVVDWGLGGFLGSHPVSVSDVDRLLPDDPRLTRISPEGAGRVWAAPGERLVYLAVGSPGIKPWLRLRSAHPTRRIEVVTTDEGLGSYGDRRSREQSWRREGGGAAWSWLRANAHAAANKMLVDQRWSLYHERNGVWTVHDPVAAEFRRTRQGETIPQAVYLTQPWVELGVVQRADYHAHVRDVAHACEKAGLDFAVRPHPAEDASLYGQWRILSGSSPAELDPRITSSMVVLGATSTALLNLAAIFGVRAIRVGGKEMAVLDELLSPRQRTLLDTFLPPLRDVSTLELIP